MTNDPTSPLSRTSALTVALVALLPVAAVAPGCAFTNDFDQFTFGDASVPGDLGDGTDGAVDAGPDMADSGPPPPQDCVEDYIAIGEMPMDDTSAATDDFTATCGGGGANDVAYEFVAPRDDYYRFSTAGSTFDTVLSLRDATCSGTELACNDNAGALPTSEIVQRIAQGDHVIAVVDGNADFGTSQLEVEYVTCPAINLDEITLPVNHTTVGQSDDHDGACGGSGVGDRAYRFTAPSDGFYRFRVRSDETAFASALYIEEGPVCGGNLLQCNSGHERLTEVSRQMTDGQVVTVHVDGDGTEVTRDDAVSTCVDGVHDQEDYTLAENGPHRMTTSCGDAAVWHLGNTDPANIRNFPDLILSFTNTDPPGGGCAVGCEFEIESEFPFFASITDGASCDGVEQSCATHSSVDTGVSPNVHSLRMPWPASDGREKVLVIDRIIGDYEGGLVFYDHGDNITIRTACFAVC